MPFPFFHKAWQEDVYIYSVIFCPAFHAEKSKVFFFPCLRYRPLPVYGGYDAGDDDFEQLQECLGSAQ